MPVLIKMKYSGITEIGFLEKSNKFAIDEEINRDLKLGTSMKLRLIIDKALIELYLDDYLISCYSLADAGISLKFRSPEQFKNLKVREVK